MIYNHTQLQKKILNPYTKGDIFISYIQKCDIFPIAVTLPKIKQSDIQNDYLGIQKEIKKLQSSHLPLLFETFSFKSLGAQNLPVKIVFEDLQTYLRYIKKELDFERFVKLFEMIIDRFSKLENLFLQKPFLILEYKLVWDELLAVVEFLLKNPHPNIYARELKIDGVDTKFIEKYKKIIDTLLSFLQDTTPLSSLANNSFEKKYHLKYPKPQVRFRILDSDLFIQGLSDITLPLDQFEKLNFPCKKVFIVENKITTLSFPNKKGSIVIFGQGYGVTLLKNIPWLKNKEIYYWGDMDLDGFAILSQLRSYYPQTISLMMDSEVYAQFSNLKTKLEKEVNIKTVTHLKEDEKRLYDTLSLNNFRLEQEYIPFGYVEEKIKKI